MMIPVKPVLAAIMSLAVASIAQAQQLSVEASKTVPLRLAGSASSIVIGNKNIADVAVHDERLIFVTGKSYGTTNLMVFNKAGEEVYSAEVVVTANSSNLVTVNRAGQNQTYDCAPVCRSALTLGDDPAYFSNLIQQQLQAQTLTGGN
ncbi:pilus assembly protein N-terminal domain-containing protein [Hyphomonas sp.]|uniref:pilus assembly protein N-terminal domain-containing protein n=1 Tax=Hyphomonas sp. TaxID=87 RepID=UPI001BCB6AD5|nr:pilus assembly protein N-terminal domain-containing protein [Hyphomonas sp.]